MSKPVRVLPAAEEDLLSIYVSIFPDNAAAAERWLEAVRKSARDLIGQHPEAGVRRDYGRSALQGLRVIGVPGFENYLVFYRVTDIEVQVVRILHGARDIPNVLDPAD